MCNRVWKQTWGKNMACRKVQCKVKSTNGVRGAELNRSSTLYYAILCCSTCTSCLAARCHKCRPMYYVYPLQLFLHHSLTAAGKLAVFTPGLELQRVVTFFWLKAIETRNLISCQGIK